MERRLAAILAADVAGYSMLMNADEAGTYSAWRAARTEVVDPCIDVCKGRIVKHTGDGFLAEFPTVLAAVECGVNIQELMAQRDTRVANDHALQFRIGINLGDIIVDDEDIHGDGVNIAARLESIAEAGGVCISGAVYNQVNNKTGFHFQDLGARTLKNIASAVRVYSVSKGGPHDAISSSPVPEPAGASRNEEFSPVEAMLDSAASSSHHRAGVVVGRDEEMQLLGVAFAEAKAGGGNIVLIRGEAGIGKSSLAYAFTETAAASKALVVYGQCHETLGSPPFWPWLQILKSLQLTQQAAQVSTANIFENLATVESPAPSSTQSTFNRNAGSEQFLLFSQIDNTLAQYAALRTLVLVIDDLHWADRSSLLLLTHLCQKLSERPILIVGTYRDIEITRKHPLFESLGDINRQATLRRIALKGLSQDDVSGFVQDTVKQQLPANVLQALYEKTEGNPLFVCEVARILQQEKSQSTGQQFIVEIPDGIQEAIGRRLNQLSDECNELLGMTSVIGRNFSLRILSALLPQSDEMSLLQTLEEAEARGIVNELAGGAARFQFCHVLMRDILYAELSLAKKIILHKKVADALAQLHSSDAEHSLGEIARHYYQALQGGQGDNAVSYAIKAAEHARKLSAFDEACGYYEIALDVFSVDEAQYSPQKAEILFEIAQCMQSTGRPNQSTSATLDRCLDEARKHSQFELFAEAACLKVHVGRSHPLIAEGERSINEALNYIAEDNLVIRAKVLAHRAASLIFKGRRRDAEQVVYEAIAIAAACGDPVVHSDVLSRAVLVLRGRPEKLTERIRLSELAISLSLSNSATTFDPREWLILSFQELGDMTRVRSLIADVETAIEVNFMFTSRYFTTGANAYLALFDGRWQDAESLIEEAEDLGANKLDGGAEGVYGAQMFFLNRELGRLPLIHSALKQMLTVDSAVWTPGLLATYTDLGIAEEAGELFAQMTADDFERVVDDELYLTTLVYLTEACMEFDFSDKAGALYQRLVPYSGQMVSHPTAVCYGPADLYLGMLSSQLNHLEEAEQLFDKAAALCERSAPNVWQSHVKYRHAQVLKRHNFIGGKASFTELVANARSTAQALGVINLLSKIELLESDAPSARQNESNGLSRRELEVLNLVAQGKSNKVIAAELNRSLATVATHVRAILSKTRTANRTEAAAFAVERQLFKEPVPPQS